MSDRKPPRVPVVLQAGIGLALLTAMGIWFTNYQTAPSSPGNAVEQLSTMVNAPPPVDPKKARDDQLAYQAQAAIAVVENEKTLQLAEDTLRTLDNADREAKAWADEVEPLLTNETGKRLAGDPARLSAFRRAYDSPRPAPSVLMPARRGVEVLKSQVDAVLKHRDTAYTASAERAKIAEALKTAQDFVDAYHTPREVIASLVRQANADSQVADRSLTAALEAETDREAAAAAQAEARRAAEAAAEAERKKDELAAQARAAEDARLSAEAAAQELRRQAEDPSVQAEFQPFLAKGLYCGGRIDNPYFLKEHGLLFPYPRPMSLGCLQANENVLQNYGAFMYLAEGQGNYRVNDRPHWHPPKNDDENRDYYRRFQLFQKLAPLWKDMGVLSP